MFSPMSARTAPIRLLFFACVFHIPTGAARPGESALTLNAAVSEALANAPEIAAQLANVDAADALTVSAGRLPDPELLLGIDDMPVTGPDAYSLSRDSFTTRKVGAMQAFPSAAKRRAEKSLAHSELGVAQASLARTRAQVAQAAAQAWIDRQLAESTLAKLDALAPQVALQETLARAGLASGRGSAADALSAQAARAQYDDRVLAAKADVQRSVAQLARWLGTDGTAALAASPNFAVLPVTAASLLDASHEHAVVAAFDAQIVAARSAVALARSVKRPDWSAELAYGNRAVFSDMVSLEFRVGLPLFTKHRQEPQIRAKTAALRQLESEREAELRMHRAELQSVLADWRSAQSRLALLERDRLPLAQSRNDVASNAYRAGSGPLRPVLDSLSEFVELQLTALALKAEAGRAWATLAYQTPTETTP